MATIALHDCRNRVPLAEDVAERDVDSSHHTPCDGMRVEQVLVVRVG